MKKCEWCGQQFHEVNGHSKDFCSLECMLSFEDEYLSNEKLNWEKIDIDLENINGY